MLVFIAAFLIYLLGTADAVSIRLRPLSDSIQLAKGSGVGQLCQQTIGYGRPSNNVSCHGLIANRQNAIYLFSTV